MAILIITTDFPPNLGGIADVFQNWAKGLAENGEEILVLAPAFAKASAVMPDFDRRQSYQIIRASSFFYPLYLLYHLSKLRPKKVIVGPVLPSGFWIFLFSFFFNFKYFVGAFGNEIVINEKNNRQKLAAFFKKMIFQKAEMILPCSQFSAGLVKKFGIANNKIKVIYPAVEFNLPQIILPKIKPADLKNKKNILTVGRLIKRKNQAKIIEAMPLILQKIPNAIYLIIGDGPEYQNLKSKIHSLRLEDKVFLLPKVTDKELPYFYQVCDLFAMASKNILKEKEVEGFGIVYLEAGLFKKPVVATKAGGVPEAVVDGKTGLLVKNPDDEKEIAAKIIKLLKNRRLARKLGGNASQRIKKELNWKVIIKKLKETLDG